ncbi:MAG: hypothetical protein FJ115_06515 [Deltaproteobacteria bacterium]|nr:hypothetical protein [Deltaproteobacteria bacterium]
MFRLHPGRTSHLSAKVHAAPLGWDIGDFVSVDKVAIYPCGGIGLHVSCVTRLAGYLLEELLKSEVETLDMHRLIRGLSDEIELIERFPTIILDGCAHQCGSNLFRLLRIKPAARIYIPEIIAETGLYPGRARKVLEDSGQRLAREVARRAARMVKGMRESPNYHYTLQKINAVGLILCDYEVDAEEALGYIKIAPGVYRPKEMNSLPGLEEKEIQL